MLTAWCLAVAFVSPWLVGIPLLWLLRGGQALRRPDWLYAPFVGLAGIVCPLQTLAVCADLPLNRTTGWLWVVVGLLWVVLLARPRGRASLRVLPTRTILLSLTAFLILGVALLQKGVEHYRGKLHSDQYNYVVLGQFLMDVPFSITWPEVGDRPWLALAFSQKADRLGLVAAHGFLAVTAGRDALDLFFPALFLSAALLVPAVRAVALRVGLLGRTADATVLLAALVPGATAIVADCYMAHAIFVPILLAFAAAVVQAFRRWSSLPVAAVLFSLGFAVYTEFTPILVGVAGAAALAARATRRASWRRVAAVLAGSGTGVLLNPAAIQAAGAIAERAFAHGRSMTPTLTMAMMFENVWLNVGAVASRGTSSAVACAVFAAFCFTLAAFGWVRCMRRGSVTRRGAAFGAAVSLMLLPVAIAVLSPGLKYAIFKLLFTASPLYALGLGFAVRRHANEGLCYARLRVAVVAFLGVWLVADTVRFQLSTHRREERILAAEWNSPEVKQVVARLNAEPAGEVVMALGPDEYAWVPVGVVMYRARQHHIQIASPRQIWLYPFEEFPGTTVGASGPPRSGAILVTRPSAEPVAGEVLLRTENYLVIRAGAPPAGHAFAGR